MTKKDKNVIVALDVQTLSEAEKLVNELSSVIRYFKVGSELFTAAGPEVIQIIRGRGCEVFLDLKFHDIPNTVASAVKSAGQLGAFMMNVHASGGKKMMAAAAAAAAELKTPPILLAVTVLTSMKADDLKEINVLQKPEDQVLHLALLAKEAGMDGVVCSGQEAALIRKAAGKKFVIVTPGVRPAGAAKGDQARVTTPEEAFANGADYIVIGRPITQADSPHTAATRIISSL